MRIPLNKSHTFPSNASWITKNQRGLRVLATTIATAAVAAAFFALSIHGGFIPSGQETFQATVGVFAGTGITLTAVNKSTRLFGTVQEKEKRSKSHPKTMQHMVTPLPKNLKATEG